MGLEESGEQIRIKGFSMSFECAVSARSGVSGIVSCGMRAGTRKRIHVATVEHAPAT